MSRKNDFKNRYYILLTTLTVRRLKSKRKLLKRLSEILLYFYRVSSLVEIRISLWKFWGLIK
jgi:hypothetical protein